MPLISTSPEFPATRLCFLNSYAFGSRASTETCNNEYVQDLLQFFALYGHKIKSLSLGNFISRKELGDILTIHTPNLNYLDLSSLSAFRPDRARKVIWETPLPVPLPIKTVRLGPCFNKLCDTAAKSAVLKILRNLDLKAIEDRNHYLYLIVPPQDGQSDNANDSPVNRIPLVKDLDYKPTIANYRTLRVFSKGQPKLTRLTVNCDGMIKFSSLHYRFIVEYLNDILESSKDTLEHFEIAFNPHRFLHNIKIPPLKNLKCLKLIQTEPCFLYEGPHQKPPNPLEHDPQLNIFLFKKSKRGYVDRNYFPKLTQVCIDVQDYEVQGKLMEFFRYKSKSPLEVGLHRKEGIFAASVKHLKLCGNGQWPKYSAINLMSKVFSGMTCIKIKCEHSMMMSMSDSHNFWSLCPSAKYIEIYGVSNGFITTEKAAQLGIVVSTPLSEDGSINSSLSSKMAAVDVDSFFTGFTRNLCYKLQSTPFPELVERDDDSIDFFRMNSSFICSLKNLKVLKISFKRLSFPFATKVTGMYAFGKMPQTKIIFSYDVTSMTSAGVKNMENQLEPVAPYVEILQEKGQSTTGEHCCGNKWL